MGGDTEPPGAIDVCVVGASAGGVEALQRFVAALAPDLPIPVVVVLHMLDGARSMLPAILERSGPLPVAAAQDGAEAAPGHVHVSVPGSHLLLDGGRLRLSSAPADHHHRPGVDLLFRSTAEPYGARVAGVILSGSGDDGAAGLAEIGARGGATLVQDPQDALYTGMPTAALAALDVDLVAPVEALARDVARLAGTDPGGHAAAGSDPLTEAS